MFSDYVYKWLSVALDYGIAEQDFWNMSIGEFLRVIESKNRVRKIEAQERATFDYVLAELIGKSISRVYHPANKMPEIAEAYPTLFDSQEMEEKKQEQKDNLSVIRFKLFADSHNKKFEEVQENK